MSFITNRQTMILFGTMIFILAITVFGGFQTYKPTVIQGAEVVTEIPKIELVLKQPEPQKPMQTGLQPVPDALIMALDRLSNTDSMILKKLSELEHRFNTAQSQSVSKKQPAVDREGNSQEALNDIFSDVVPPELPDPMVKALARYPGSRIIADPDTGVTIPAVTEWRQTSWGGGKQLHLLRHKGKVYGQTVLHKGKEPTPAPRPEPFRIGLSNN